ncbi:Plant transposon protein [Fragilaria crotonensis]|nr:Plant transposon protein [Fragilaria crotonensis]
MLWNDDEELEAIITVMESDSDDHDSGIVAEVIIRNPPPAAGRWGLTPLQKICSSIRQLTSAGVSSAEHDDKYRMAASTGMDAMKHFCNAIIAVYSEDALRPPNVADLNRLLDEGNKAGFPGCIGMIDCMHRHRNTADVHGKECSSRGGDLVYQQLS